MAHELELGGIDNRIEAAFALEPGWHGLGTVLNYVPDSEAMIQAAGLDWEVGLIDTQGVIKGGKNDGLVIPSVNKMTVRMDTFVELGTVSGKYQLIQNKTAFKFLDSLMQDGIMRYESAGAIKGGKTVWVLARMPEVDTIAEGDNCNRYVLFTTSHDGSACLHVIPTSVRVVCNNTYRAAIQGDKGIRHMGDMAGKLADAHLYISQLNSSFTLFRDNARRLADVKITKEGAIAYLAELFPEVKEPGRAQTIQQGKIAKVRANWTNERQTIKSIQGTWWALYNSISEMIDHQSTFRGGAGRERAENRMLSTVDGDGAAFKNRAFDLAVRMAGGGLAIA